jgi:ketosteroid isomerase-like protein
VTSADSEDPVAILRRVYERWSQGDFADTEFFDPQVQFIMGPGFPEAGTYLGIGQLGGYMRGFLESWEHIAIQADELAGVGDSVVAAVRQEGTGRGSGAAARLDYFQVWTFRGGRAIRFETFRERADAYAAVGLDPG